MIILMKEQVVVVDDGDYTLYIIFSLMVLDRIMSILLGSLYNR